MVITRSHVFIGLTMMLLLFAVLIPQENTYNDQGPDNNQSTDNSTNSNQPVDQDPLMSSIDTVVDDENGWWKHDGHSTVTNENQSASGDTSSTESGIIDEDEGDGTGDENEIPEFPNVTIPMVAVLVLALSFRKN